MTARAANQSPPSVARGQHVSSLWMRGSGAPWAGFVYPDLEVGFKDGAEAPEISFIRLSMEVTNWKSCQLGSHTLFSSVISLFTPGCLLKLLKSKKEYFLKL